MCLATKSFHVENLLINIYSTLKIAIVSLLVFTTEQTSKLNTSSIIQAAPTELLHLNSVF